jgi:hypothetical protein
MVTGETRKMRDTAVEWCGREERGWGEHAAVAWGKKPQRQSESEHPKTIKERRLLEKESHHFQRLPETGIQRLFHLRSLSENRGDSLP